MAFLQVAALRDAAERDAEHGEVSRDADEESSAEPPVGHEEGMRRGHQAESMNPDWRTRYEVAVDAARQGRAAGPELLRQRH